MVLPHNVTELAHALVNIPSVSGDEHTIAGIVEDELRSYSHLDVVRDGDAVVARTHGGNATRIVLAGHLDTVPIAANVPGTLSGSELWGRGSVDMKAGDAVFLALARELSAPRMEVTYVFYDHEEVAAPLNGLGRIARNHPEWLRGDLAVLGEPTSGAIEGGCNGTLRMRIHTHGVAAHSARPWMGVNAIHGLGEILRRLERYPAQTHTVDGLDFRESLLAVAIEGGKSLNSVPDAATVTVNFRFAPDRSEQAAADYVRSLFSDLPVDFEITDLAPGARPGMDHSELHRLAAILRSHGAPEPTAKLGWTDVARFSSLGIPAVNCGPGDPLLAHADNEACPVGQIERTFQALQEWLA